MRFPRATRFVLTALCAAALSGCILDDDGDSDSAPASVALSFPALGTVVVTNATEGTAALGEHELNTNAAVLSPAPVNTIEVIAQGSTGIGFELSYSTTDATVYALTYIDALVSYGCATATLVQPGVALCPTTGIELNPVTRTVKLSNVKLTELTQPDPDPAAPKVSDKTVTISAHIGWDTPFGGSVAVTGLATPLDTTEFNTVDAYTYPFDATDPGNAQEVAEAAASKDTAVVFGEIGDTVVNLIYRISTPSKYTIRFDDDDRVDTATASANYMCGSALAVADAAAESQTLPLCPTTGIVFDAANRTLKLTNAKLDDVQPVVASATVKSVSVTAQLSWGTPVPYDD